MKHLTKNLTAPMAFALAFFLAGTPSAPVTTALLSDCGLAFATGPGYTGSAGGVSSPPGEGCDNWYDHSANSWGRMTLTWAHLLRDQMDDSPVSGACIDCEAYAEEQETHALLAIGMGISGALIGGPIAPLLAISAGGNALSAWAYGRTMRMAGC